MLAMHARTTRAFRQHALSLTSIASMPQAGTRSYKKAEQRQDRVPPRNAMSLGSLQNDVVIPAPLANTQRRQIFASKIHPRTRDR